jgi:hypothetical protein
MRAGEDQSRRLRFLKSHIFARESGFVSAFSTLDIVPFEVLREALRTTARDARGGFVSVL